MLYIFGKHWHMYNCTCSNSLLYFFKSVFVSLSYGNKIGKFLCAFLLLLLSSPLCSQRRKCHHLNITAHTYIQQITASKDLGVHQLSQASSLLHFFSLFSIPSPGNVLLWHAKHNSPPPLTVPTAFSIWSLFQRKEVLDDWH